MLAAAKHRMGIIGQLILLNGLIIHEEKLIRPGDDPHVHGGNIIKLMHRRMIDKRLNQRQLIALQHRFGPFPGDGFPVDSRRTRKERVGIFGKEIKAVNADDPHTFGFLLWIGFLLSQDDHRPLQGVFKPDLFRIDNHDLRAHLPRITAQRLRMHHVNDFRWDHHAKPPALFKQRQRGEQKRDPGIGMFGEFLLELFKHQLRLHLKFIFEELVADKRRVAYHAIIKRMVFSELLIGPHQVVAFGHRRVGKPQGLAALHGFLRLDIKKLKAFQVDRFIAIVVMNSLNKCTITATRFQHAGRMCAQHPAGHVIG